ncbi:MAG: DUF4445 domain-containing protein, partial [Woeseiaceae bacterium]|nr:DUF4445 domain-containing protein [Woeseiaceae bacterium]
LNRAARREIEAVVREIEKIETAVEPKFQEYFVDAMALPNKSDPFDILFSVIDRPERKSTGDNVAKSGRRRRRRAS